MSKIKGQNFRIFLDSDAVIEAVSCSCTLQGNTEDTSTKDTEGMFSQDTVVSKSWNVQVDSYNGDTDDMQSLIQAFRSRTAQSVAWDQTTGAAGTMNRTAANANFKRSGTGYITDLTFVFNDRQTVSTSIQIQGTGALS